MRLSPVESWTLLLLLGFTVVVAGVLVDQWLDQLAAWWRRCADRRADYRAHEEWEERPWWTP